MGPRPSWIAACRCCCDDDPRLDHLIGIHHANAGARPTGPRRPAKATHAAAVRRRPLSTISLFVLAALAEIAGCFAFWSWARVGRSAWWLAPGVAALVLFAWLLTRAEVDAAGRAYAAYGGVYILASLAWLWAIEGVRPDHWDLAGATLCLTGAAVILWAPRAA